jgi:hypothetical protein
MLPHLSSIFFGSSASGFAAIGLAVVLGLFVLFMMVYAFFAYCTAKIFEKAGRPGWPAIIPVYNTWILYQIAGKPGWLALIVIFFFIPLPPLAIIAGLILLVITLIVDLELSKRFGKGVGFAIVLFLLPWIGIPILAFGKAQYNGPHKDGAAPLAPPQGPTPLPSEGLATVSPDPGVVAPGAPAPTPPQPPVPLPPTSPAPPEVQPPNVPPTPPTPPLPPSPIQ